MQGSPYTLLVYRQAFGGDLMTDLVGAYGQSDAEENEPPGSIVPEVSTFLQVAWAMARTHSDEVPDYPDWLRSFDPREFSLGDNASLEVIDSAIAAELFCQRQTGLIRQWISKQLERLAQFARSVATRIRA